MLADSNSWSAVHKHDTLANDQWWYSTKSINSDNLTTHLNYHPMTKFHQKCKANGVSHLNLLIVSFQAPLALILSLSLLD